MSKRVFLAYNTVNYGYALLLLCYTVEYEWVLLLTYNTVENERVLPYDGIPEYDALPDPGPPAYPRTFSNAHIGPCQKRNPYSFNQ
jgi:hypothetical protein